MKDKIVGILETYGMQPEHDYYDIAEELLNLFSVSQQRELLLAFFDLADELPMGLGNYDREKIVEEFLANNCG